MPSASVPPRPDTRSIQAFVAEHATLTGPLEATALAGGLSPRRFIRVKLGNAESAVVMVVPPETPDEPSRSLTDANGRSSNCGRCSRASA